MTMDYGSNLDLNLLRVFAVVADAGSVTTAASRLYLTQPAVSAALRRLNEAVGAALFARQGRGLVLTSRGERLLAAVRPSLSALVEAALRPAAFDAKTSERTLRLGVADATEAWLVPALLRTFAREAPHMRLVVVPVQFRTAAEALVGRQIDAAVTVADEMPSSVRRRPLFHGDFVCLFDERRVRRPITEKVYFAHEHVIVSYNGDLRGIVEDALGKNRNVRCSVASFTNIAKIIEDTALLGTVPRLVGEYACSTRRHLATAELPFALEGATTELLWPAATDDDPACAFLRDAVADVVSSKLATPSAGARSGRPAAPGAKPPRPPARTRSSRRSAARGRPRRA